jgi:hypothetical protein
MNADENSGIKQDIRDIHSKMDRRDVRVNDKLDKLLDNQGGFRERVATAEAVMQTNYDALIPMAKKVGRHERFVNGFFAVGGVCAFGFAATKFFESIGVI